MPYLTIKESADQIASNSKLKCGTYLLFFLKKKKFWKHFHENFPETVPANMENFIPIFMCWLWHKKNSRCGECQKPQLT